ncbi:MAG: 4-hydroxy-3-methylbut-2-enyl diphosphate reductase [Eubacterium sp.]|nr:4-hydroxy-3-methylbut-2-enyl diphosphate reductase [Eubacterium sp.]
MRIEVADHAGFCFGVKRAVDSVYELLDGEEKSDIVTLGPIIHNERVVDELKNAGVQVIKSPQEAPEGATIVIRSHGVPEAVIREIDDRGLKYVDETCPFVKKIHEIVREHSLAGEEIVIFGSKSHPEIVGILGWSVNGGTVIESREEALAYRPESPTGRVCVVAQTTFSVKKFQDYVEIFQKKEYDIIVVNTICRATQARQEAAEALSRRSDAMIVIGGADSSNSRKLYEICKQQCANTFFIQTADSLGEISFDGFASLGITAGASTPNTLIQEVLEACQKK